jgi:predicted nucleotidyltransferase component of viral defense system
MEWKILDDKRISLLQRMDEHFLRDEIYLAGGTGLSLLKGYRRSVDFDFFTSLAFNNSVVLEKLGKVTSNLRVLQNQEGTLDVLLDGIQVSLFRYSYPLIGQKTKAEGFRFLQIASVTDIALMKMVAIGSRGNKKDFFDLYWILQDDFISPEKMISLMKKKFGNHQNFSYISMALTYFEDADCQILPEIYVPSDWEEIKKFFRHYAKAFRKACFEEAERENS